MIEKIEKLDCLLGLQILDLSSNLISKIEGLDQLHQLQSLNLNDNRIEAIPAGTGKKLKCLQILGIARNQLSSVCFHLLKRSYGSVRNTFLETWGHQARTQQKIPRF